MLPKEASVPEQLTVQVCETPRPHSVWSSLYVF